MSSSESDFTAWQGKVAVLTLYSNLNVWEIATVHVLLVDARRGELVGEILETNQPPPKRPVPGRYPTVVPFRRIFQIASAPENARPPAVPLKLDRCFLRGGLSLGRAAVFIFLAWALALGIVVMAGSDSFGRQIGWAIAETAMVVIVSFMRLRDDAQRFLFTCPVVWRQFPPMFGRH